MQVGFREANDQRVAQVEEALGALLQRVRIDEAQARAVERVTTQLRVTIDSLREDTDGCVATITDEVDAVRLELSRIKSDMDMTTREPMPPSGATAPRTDESPVAFALLSAQDIMQARQASPRMARGAKCLRTCAHGSCPDVRSGRRGGREHAALVVGHRAYVTTPEPSSRRSVMARRVRHPGRGRVQHCHVDVRLRIAPHGASLGLHVSADGTARSC